MQFIINKLKENITFDLKMLAFFRVCLGIILFIDVIDRARDIEIFYSDKGAFPLTSLYSMTNIRSTFSLNLINGSTAFQALILIIMGILSISLIMGFKTRLSVILLWIFVVSIQNRNISILQGGDDYIRLILFWSMFLPLGAKLSLDRFLMRSEIKTNKYSSLSVLAFVLQICFVYYFTSQLKSSPIWNQDFTAGSYIYQLDMFTKLLGKLLFNFPPLLKLMTFLVYHLEHYISLLILFPFFNKYTRTIGALLIIFMQIGFGLSLELGPFPLISIAAMIPLISSEVINQYFKIGKNILKKAFRFKIFDKKVRDIKEIQVIYNHNNLNQFKTVRLLQTFGLMDQISYVNNSLLKNDYNFKILKNNQEIIGYNAFLEIIYFLPILGFIRPLSKTKFIKKSLTAIYYLILKLQIKFNSKEFNFYSLSNITICTLTSVLFISWIFAWNMNTVNSNSYIISSTANNIISFLRLDQKWGMFAPYPFTDDGWYVILAKTRSDDTYSIFGNKESTSLNIKPGDIANSYPNERWRKYLTNLYDNSYSEYRRLFLDYLCKKSNNNDYTKQYVSIDMYYVLTRIESPKGKMIPNQILLLNYMCS